MMNLTIKHLTSPQPNLGGLSYWSNDCAMNVVRELSEGLS